MDIMQLNFLYAALGGLLALFLMVLSYKVMDSKFVTTDFDTGQQLRDGNVAVGLLMCGIMIGIGVSVGLTVSGALG